MACNSTEISTTTPNNNNTNIKGGIPEGTKIFKKSYKLCETENPNFDAKEECLAKIKEECPTCYYMFEFKNTKYTAFGSCRDCVVTYAKKADVKK